MFVSDYLKQQIETNLGGDRARFNELWDLVPNFSARISSYDSDSAWLHWRPKTFDGWYCVSSGGGYVVYYQERGIRSDVKHFQSEREAVWCAVDTAVLSLAT